MLELICYATHSKSYMVQLLQILSANNSCCKKIFTTSKEGFTILGATAEVLPTKIPLLKTLRSSFKIKAALKQFPQAIFCTDNVQQLRKTTTKQLLFIADTAGLSKTTASIAKIKLANRIFVAEQYMADFLVKEMDMPNEKISIVHFPLQELQESTTDNFKDIYTEGYEYFLFDAATGNKQYLLMALKAFSQFKKWQKSAMKFVVLNNEQMPEKLVDNFAQYKYADDIVFLPISKMQEAMEHCYGAITMERYKPNGFGMLAIQLQAPLIIGQSAVNHAIFGPAALYCEDEASALSKPIQLLYTNEQIAANLRYAGQQLLQNYITVNPNYLLELINNA
jgi:hypothetical protein